MKNPEVPGKMISCMDTVSTNISQVLSTQVTGRVDSIMVRGHMSFRKGSSILGNGKIIKCMGRECSLMSRENSGMGYLLRGCSNRSYKRN